MAGWRKQSSAASGIALKPPATGNNKLKVMKRGKVKDKTIPNAKEKSKSTDTVIKLGGDCDGLCTAAIAFEMMNVPFEHVFGSEKDEATRAVLYGNHSIEKVYKDWIIDLLCRASPCNSAKGTLFAFVSFVPPRSATL